MSCSESASSFQSVSQTSTPEILVGLIYNATTGRLSVEVIKGIHFKNLAANKPPSKYTKTFLKWFSERAVNSAKERFFFAAFAADRSGEQKLWMFQKMCK